MHDRSAHDSGHDANPGSEGGWGHNHSSEDPPVVGRAEPGRGRRHRSRVLLAVLATLLIGGAAAAHIALQFEPRTYAGPLLVADHVFDLALALALLIVCAAVGRLVLRRLAAAFDRPPEELVFATALGSAIVAVIFLACGLLGALQTPILVLVLLACAVVARRDVATIPRLAGDSVRFIWQRAGHPAFAVACLAVMIVVSVILVIQAVAPPTDWDSLMYHLEVPRQFLEADRILLLEDNIHVAFVGLVHMLSLPLLALHSPTGPAILSALFALLLGVAVFSLAERYFDGVTASLSLLTLWAATSILLVAITPRIDVTLALYIFLAQYSLMLALSNRERRTLFFLAALFFGCAVGIKFVALAYAVALAPLVLWVAWDRERSLAGAAPKLALFAVVGLVAVAPWLGKNWLLLDAPFYPYLSDRVLEPWLAAIYGAAGIPDAVNPAVFAAISKARMPFNLVDLFLAPGRLTVEQEGVHYHMNMLLLLTPFALLYLRNRFLQWLIAPAVFYLLLILIPFPETNLRYLIPVFPPLTIASASVATRISQRFLSPGAARLLLVSLAVLTLYPSGKTMQIWLRRSDVLGHLAGLTSEASYLRTGFFFYSQMTEAANRVVPDGGKVLLLFEARGYYFEPAVIQDNLLTNWALLAPYTKRHEDCLVSSDISHVLVSDAAVRYYARRGMDPRLLGLEDLSSFAARCLSVVHRGRGFTILMLNPSGPVSEAPTRGTPVQPSGSAPN